jgi:hypothetical protein
VSLSYEVISLKWCLVSGSLYIIGAIIYGSRYLLLLYIYLSIF